DFFFQAEDGIRDFHVTGVQTCALPIWELVLLDGIDESHPVTRHVDVMVHRAAPGPVRPDHRAIQVHLRLGLQSRASPSTKPPILPGEAGCERRAGAERKPKLLAKLAAFFAAQRLADLPANSISKGTSDDRAGRRFMKSGPGRRLQLQLALGVDALLATVGTDEPVPLALLPDLRPALGDDFARDDRASLLPHARTHTERGLSGRRRFGGRGRLGRRL